LTESLLPRIVPETEDLKALRKQVRAYLADRIARGAFVPGVDTWLTRWDRDFTRDLARQGWVGMTIPVEYGGHGRTFMERFVVTEELLAVGAPVAAQWVADRQIAPTLLRFGTEHQRRTFLPAIAAGECSFAIGMSEPDSGSDLASVRTKASRVEGGWRLTGTKVWTSGAHNSDAFFAFARTSPVDPQNRHAGLSQFIVDLRREDVQIRPIRSMTGEHHFNEVYLDGTFVPNDMVLGEIGSGWRQVTSELGFERSGPERYMSTFVLWAEVLELSRTGALPRDITAGRTLARMRGMHQMSMAVSAALQRGEEADIAAAVVKVLGTRLEGDIAEDAHLLANELGPVANDERFSALLSDGLLQRPGFTLRGGTNEILRGVIARGLGMR
jgi:acyl-CoA dehydrogenase